MRQVARRFLAAASEIGSSREAFGIIHGDFTFDSVLFHRGEVRVIDFDDCGRGYYLYEIATLLDRIEWREDYAALRAGLLRGYREERALPSEHEAAGSLSAGPMDVPRSGLPVRARRLARPQVCAAILRNCDPEYEGLPAGAVAVTGSTLGE